MITNTTIHVCLCYISRDIPLFVSVNDWLNNFEHKVTSFVNMRDTLDEIEAIKMGKKDPDAEVNP